MTKSKRIVAGLTGIMLLCAAAGVSAGEREESAEYGYGPGMMMGQGMGG